MKNFQYFLILILLASCGSKKEIMKNSEADMIADLLAQICSKEQLNSAQYAIENITNRKLKNNFHCSLEPLDKNNFLVKIILIPKLPDEDLPYKEIEVNDFKCFLYDSENISSSFYTPDAPSWHFLTKKLESDYLYYRLDPYTLDRSETEIKL